MSQQALELILENKRTKEVRLDLGNCGMTKLPKELFECVWLEELILSNKWKNEFSSDWTRSKNAGNSNLLSNIPLDIRKLVNLKILRIGGDHDNKWKIRDLYFLQSKEMLLYEDVNWNQFYDVESFDKELQLTGIDLSYNEISDISLLALQPELQSLILSNNLIENIDSLISLNELNLLYLDNNRISNLDSIKKLYGLRDLKLHTNRIEDTTPLSELFSLQYLDLSWNFIRDFSGLKNLINLRSLRLSSALISDIGFLEGLIGLFHLDLSNNRFLSKVDVLRNCNNLVWLYLNNCSISNLNFLEGLKELEQLELRGNSILNITELKSVTRIKHLNLNDNFISHLDALSKLKFLEYLDLSNNRIANLKSLSNLKLLRLLNLSDNVILEIESLYPIINLNKNIRIDLYNNPFLGKMPKEVVNAGWPAIWDRLIDLKEGVEFVEIKEVKVLLLGNTNVGKSNLLEHLETGKEPLKNTTTFGIQFRALKNTVEGTILNCWDFGGQDYFHATHQLFFSPGALNIVIWSIRNEVRNPEEVCYDLHYWFRCIEQIVSNFFDNAEKKIEVIVIENKIDYQGFQPTPVNQELYQNKFSNLNLNFAAINLKPLRYVQGFKDLMSERMDRLYNKYQLKYKRYLSLIRNYNGPFLPLQYINPFDRKIKDTAIPVFRNMGILLYFPQIIPDKVFHKPQKLLDLLYKKVLSKELREAKEFSITKEKIKKVIAGNDLELSMEEVIGLLQHFDLIFSIPKLEDVFFIPQYMPAPNKLNRDYKEDAFFDADIIIKSDHYLMNLAMLKIFSKYGKYAEEDKITGYQFWKDSIIIEKGLNKLLIEFNRKEDRIELYPAMKGNNFELQNELVNFLIHIDPRNSGPLKDSNESSYENKDIYWLSEKFEIYVSVDGGYFADWKELIDKSYREAWQIDTVLLKDSEKKKLFPVTAFKRFIPDKIKNKMKKTVFICYSHEDIAFTDSLKKYLDTIKSDGLIDIWDDGLLEGGDIWDNKIKTGLMAADICILMVSQDLIVSKYVKEVEFKKIMEKRRREECRILPVLVKSCDWKNWKVYPDSISVKLTAGNDFYSIKSFQFLPLDEKRRMKPIAVWEHPEDAWMQVCNTIRSFCDSTAFNNFG
jgi:internalin A